jgi:DNA-binding LacI/PurR family transcriptional regulator
MPRKKKVTMQDIADQLEISKNAVSLALMNKNGVSEELKAQIHQTAKELGYERHLEKQQLVNNILIMIPERIMSYEDKDHFLFYHDLIWGLEASVREKYGNAVIARISDQMERTLELPNLIHELSYSGIILFGIVSKDYALKVQQYDIPLILFDSYHREIACPAVTSANVEGAYEAVQFLIKSGHRKIGFIGPTNLTTSHDERWFGYMKAMMDLNIPHDPKLSLTQSAGFQSTREEIGNYWDEMTDKPSAIMCGNDRTALLLMELLQERQVRIPEDVSVIGFDDLEISSASNPPLTTMRVNRTEMCSVVVDLLNQLSTYSNAMIKWSVPPTLIVRESVAKI